MSEAVRIAVSQWLTEHEFDYSQVKDPKEFMSKVCWCVRRRFPFSDEDIEEAVKNAIESDKQDL